MYCGDVVNRPPCTVLPSDGRVTVPTLVQAAPVAEEYPVITGPDLTSRSQPARSAGPGMSPVKLSCIRTPWPPVTMSAAYTDPPARLALRMIPALAHGTTTRAKPRRGAGTALVSDVTRAVMTPSPVSGWWTK